MPRVAKRPAGRPVSTNRKKQKGGVKGKVGVGQTRKKKRKDGGAGGEVGAGVRRKSKGSATKGKRKAGREQTGSAEATKEEEKESRRAVVEGRKAAATEDAAGGPKLLGSTGTVGLQEQVVGLADRLGVGGAETPSGDPASAEEAEVAAPRAREIQARNPGFRRRRDPG